MPYGARIPYIPENITVHLGRPDEDASNVTVPFIEYIKNVASSEIFPTWPESAIIANIYAQISFALNRVYLEWYRSQGYNFDITNSTAFDQAYVPGREIFSNISRIVDNIFNNYVRKEGAIEPYFTEYCNGTTVTCEGLSQWGTVNLAEQGLTPYEILQTFYGDDIHIVRNVPIQNIEESYPGVPLRLGSFGNEVKILQTQLNRIGENFPSIPVINIPDGVFGIETESAVIKFQEIFDLMPDGIVGKSTWYKIKNVYNNVKRLSELSSEGLKYSEVRNIFPENLREGSMGEPVSVVQYYIDVIAYFNSAIPIIKIDGVFGSETKNSVMEFQRFYGLPVTGVVDRTTWNTIQNVYFQIVESLNSNMAVGKAIAYPGYFLKRGMENNDVKLIQIYLNEISKTDPQIPSVSITGFFGNQTVNAVRAIQEKYGITQSGNIGPLTWRKIADLYNECHGYT